MKTTSSNSDAAGLPDNDNDNRPFIKDLLAQHSAAVEGVRNAIQSDEICKDLYNRGDNAKRYDDIWILRFVLSHEGNVASASKAALKTIRFRDEKKLNELGDIRHRIRGSGSYVYDEKNSSEMLPGIELYTSFCAENALTFTLPDKDRGFVIYVDIGMIDQQGIVEGMSEEDLLCFEMFFQESSFQVLDDVTRRTGRLTKLIRIVDAGKLSMGMINRTYLNRCGACNKAMEDYYPQNLGCVYIANSPSWLSALFFALRPFFPIENTDFLPPLSKLKKSKDAEKHLKSLTGYVALEHLPERYGGMNKEWPLPCASLQFQPPSWSQ